MKAFDKSASSVQETRNAMNSYIGEIISTVVGNDTLQKIFEQPEHNEEYITLNNEGKPSGIIALELGIIDQETKTALLVAQAAERIARNANLAVEIKAGNLPETAPMNMDNDVFKFVGSDRDPEALKEAEASWQISQGYAAIQHDNATRDPEDTSIPNMNFFTDNEDYPNALLKASSIYYAQVANTLETAGFEDAAVKLRAASQSILPENASEIKVTPNNIANGLLSDTQHYERSMEIALGSDHYTDGTSGSDKIQKLVDLTANQAEKGFDQVLGLNTRNPSA